MVQSERGRKIMGRKRKNQMARKSYSIRMTEFERGILEEHAKEQGMNASEYIRHLALCGGQVDAHVHEDRRLLLAQIARIGNNINQIARRANENQFISSVDLDKVWEMLKEIQKEVSAVGQR